MKTKNPHQNLHDKAEVLIALAAQESEEPEQPPSPKELADFFANSKRFSKQRQEEILAYLDSNPQAYDRWIRQGKQATQQKRAPSLFSIMPYALAACLAVLVVGTVLMFPGQSFELDQAVDRAYQAAVSGDDTESFQDTMESLTGSLQQATQPLSFSQSGQPSPLAQAFTLGLRYDWNALGQQTFDSNALDDSQQKDYQLGRWYTVLWTVSQHNKAMPTDFWREQLGTLDHLQTHYAGRAQEMATTEIQAIGLQLERIQAPLSQLAGNSQDTRPYQQLEQALNALRYSLMPSL